MTSELQQTRYDRLVRRVGAIIGPGSKVSEALSELFPTLDVELVPGELLVLGGTNLSEGAAQVTGAAGQVPKCQVFNPVDSGVLVTVSSLIVGLDSVGIIRVATSNTPFATGIGTEIFRERRLPLVARPVAQMRTESTVAFVNANISFRVLANVTHQIQDPNGLAVLPPGSGFEVSPNIAASTINVSFLWRERPAEPSELNL